MRRIVHRTRRSRLNVLSIDTTFSSQFLGAEQTEQLGSPKCKYPFKVLSHKEPVYQRSPPNGITNMVDYLGIAVLLGETVIMNPCSVRTSHLFVNKASWWVPESDFASPAQR